MTTGAASAAQQNPAYRPARHQPHGRGRRNDAEATQRVIDEEVANLLRAAEQRATELLGGHREALDRLVADLLAHETVDGDAVKAALTGQAGPSQPAESGGPMPQVQYQSKVADRWRS